MDFQNKLAQGVKSQSSPILINDSTQGLGLGIILHCRVQGPDSLGLKNPGQILGQVFGPKIGPSYVDRVIAIQEVNTYILFNLITWTNVRSKNESY